MAFTFDSNGTDDLIDVRDLIERFEQLEKAEKRRKNKSEEFKILKGFLSDLEGNGGDEQWRGEWYPITLIRESYFRNYAQELADDIGAINSNATWPNNCIDWERAARELQYDYTCADLDGVTYWFR